MFKIPDRRRFLRIVIAGLPVIGLSAAGHAAEPSGRASLKKGFCVTAREESRWQEKLAALNVKWFYSWGSNKPAGIPAGVEFVPMVWGGFNPDENARLQQLAEQGKDEEVRFLMGFNEPDQHDQSNLSVEQAIRLWPHLESTGLPLCSPGCVHPDRQWMIDFMSQAEERGLRVDYVCVHSYGGPSPRHLVDRLRKVHEMYGRPIWITEFAVGDWQARQVSENRHSPRQVAAFMKEVVPMLEELEFVHRYAWFSASPDNPALGTSALFDEDGRLTDLGRLYRSF